MKFLRTLLFSCLAIFCVAAGAQNLLPVPPLEAHVTDQVGMLNTGQRAALEKTLSDYETRTGSQIVILIVNSTEPEAIEQYSIRVADAWKLGRKGIDDGVILLVARGNSAASGRLRLETGRGVQGVLTDAQAKRVLQDVIAPYFRQKDFYGGLAAGVTAITGLLNGESLPPPTQDESRQDTGLGWAPFIFFAILIVLTLMRSRGGRMMHSRDGWGNGTGVILGSAIGSGFGRSSGGGFGSAYTGGGGGFDGGGASGNW